MSHPPLGQRRLPALSAEVAHTLAVAGLDCPDEAALIRDALLPLPGVRAVTFDYAAGIACVRCADATCTSEALAAAITAAGLPARPVAAADAGAGEAAVHRARRLTVVLAAVAALLAGGGFASEVARAGGIADALTGAGRGPLGLALYGLAIALCWARLLPRAWAALRHLRADMYLLMLLAVAGAIALGDWAEAATVSVLFLVSLALEAWSGGRARAAIAALMGLAPTRARVRDAHGHERQADPATVVPGTLVVVQPGERVPLDGIVVEGASHVDESALTGESLPVARGPGAAVSAGTVNGEGLLLVRTSSAAADSTLARMARLVADARQRRGRRERWVDAFAARYTPAVVAAAVLVACLPPLLAGAAWGTWVYRALVLLVIACPCALVIATPVATVAALARAARMGVLIKGGEHLEAAARLRAIAFDKTGTLTTGRPAVTAVEPAEGVDATRLLEVAAALAQRSDHPLARALAAHAAGNAIAPPPAADLAVVPGRGITARLDGGAAWLGSPRFAAERVPALAGHALLAGGDGAAGLVAVGLDDRLLGVVRVADAVRPEAAGAVAALRSRGVAAIAMLTGDDRRVAQRIAAGLGIARVEAELLPADKVARVADLAAAGGPLAMVGDGVNDAPALARADLGIALGAAAAPAALETADVAVMRDDLGRLPWLIDHARRARAIVVQNLVAALAAKAVFLALTLSGHASLWLAIAADTGVSLLVTLNALRLLGPAVAPPHPPEAERIHAHACCHGGGCAAAPSGVHSRKR